MKRLTLTILLFSISLTLSANQNPYHGQQTRELKSLSEQDIKDLTSGSGWGLAKPAELNGIPGPAHLLELKEKIGLSELQVEKIESIWSEMNRSAKHYGQSYLSIEEKIEHFFRHQQQDTAVLQELLSESSLYLAKLRETHLGAHLKVRPLLSEQQVMQYNQLRGYSSKSEHNQHKSHENVR